MNPVEYLKSLGWYMTSPYGQRTGIYAGFHRGIDFGGFPCGAPVPAVYDGVVTAAKTSGMGTWGNAVCIKVSEDYTTLNAHLQKILVKEGQKVKRGDIIGLNGGTNHSGAAYACHIHLEIQKNTGTAPWRGEHIDPAKFSLGPVKPSTKFRAKDMIRNKLNSTAVWVRKTPGTGGATLGQIAAGKTALVLSHADNGIKAGAYHWFYVQADKLQGWVAEDFFEVTKFFKVVIEEATKNQADQIEAEAARLGIKKIEVI